MTWDGPNGKKWGMAWKCGLDLSAGMYPELGNENKTGRLGFIGDYTTQLYGEYNNKLVDGFKYLFIFTIFLPLFGEDEPILTILSYFSIGLKPPTSKSW